MKRYWLFGFNRCYPLGGMQDFRKDFDTISECHHEYGKQIQDFYQIFDSKDRIVLFDSDLPDEDDIYEPKNHDDCELYTPLYKHLEKLYPKKLWTI